MPTAKSLALRLGDKLVGRQVDTIPYGEWPGGIATVTQVRHDSNAPEIAFLVRADFWADGEMGVFGDEPVRLLKRGRPIP